MSYADVQARLADAAAFAARPRNIHHSAADLPALRERLASAIAVRDRLQQSNRDAAAEADLVEANRTCAYYRELIDRIAPPRPADVALRHS